MKLSVLAILVAGLALGCSSGSQGEEDNSHQVDVTGDVQGGDVANEVSEDLSSPDADTVVPIDWDAFYGTPDLTSDGKRRIVVLHTNDLHAHHNGTGPAVDFSPNVLANDETKGGLSRVAAIIERERRSLPEGTDLLVVDAGDFSFGSAFAALAKEHGTELKAMAAMGYVATTVGNHEMDWSPAGFAQVLAAGLADNDSLHVLASNLVFSAESGEDDELEAMLGTKLHTHTVITTPNGAKVGLFGILGKGAYSLAPHAEPVTVADPIDTARAMVQKLRDDEGADLVLCLSHSGVGEGTSKGEDEAMSLSVEGIDLIVGGHSHTLLEEPYSEGNAPVVQAGCYGLHVGRAVLVETEPGVWALESWKTIEVDDSIPGLPEIQEIISNWQALLDDELFSAMEHGYLSPVAKTGQDVMPEIFAESPVGNLVADAVRWSASKHNPRGPVVAAFEANGVVRDGLRSGKTGVVTLADVLTVLPLGYGPDGQLGYPILDFFVTAKEIRLALEVICGVAPMFSDAFFLQVSGIRFECNSKGKLFEQVGKVWLGNEVDGYPTTPLDTSDNNTELYHIATNLYIAQMMSVLKSMTVGKLAIELKDEEGKPIEDLYQFIITRDDGASGSVELKHWYALYEYLLSFEKGEAELPEIPSSYASKLGRIITK